uniref:Uncharacterized protein n=1 Tax=Populus trichocarpa TaxID=3694 RepID=B9GTU6_POPTR
MKNERSGLSWSVDEKSLKDAFSSFGDVSLKELLWQTCFSKEDEAVSAKDAMDWKVTMALIVNNFIAGIVRSSIEDKLCSEGVRGGPVGVPRLPNGGDGASNGNA